MRVCVIPSLSVTIQLLPQGGSEMALLSMFAAAVAVE
jgi:hypothetical protein